jgi:hypothetical protein
MWEADLTPLDGTNMAVYINPSINDNVLATGVIIDQGNDNSVLLNPGNVYVSKVANPLVRQWSTEVCGGDILAMAPACRPIYSGGFGRYPIYLFTSQGIISDWLYVAQFPEWGNINSEMYTEYASHKHHIAEKWGEIKDSLGGQLQGDETDWDGGHSHRIRHIQWFPRVNDKAICLFPSGSDSHGYIVGCINQ